MGVPDKFIEQGTPQELHHECGFDVQSIINQVKALTKPNILSNVG
jgi:1-deoxy-D-xylulose-5-phosphate synthase